MKVISTICGLLVIGFLFALPVFLFKLIKKYLFTKVLDRALVIKVGGCLAGMVLFTIVGVLTSPATWCEHEYAVVEDVAPTCTEKGKIVKVCPLCDNTTYDYPEKLSHSWGESITVAPTCSQEGYTKKTCSRCSTNDIEYINKIAHNWVSSASVAATCTEGGEKTKKCTMCSTEDIEYTNKLPHSWQVVSVVNATCTSGGYTLQKCSVCSEQQKINAVNKLDHSMQESSRIESTLDAEGKIVNKCIRCDYEEVRTIPKLDPIVIKFDGLELTFGQYSFTEVGNKYSDYYGKTVVKIPVTIKNLSNDPHSLYVFYCKLFGVSGVESPDVSYYFSDDATRGGDLLSGKSYVKYFYIVYDGDGTYTIVFDDFLYDKKTVEITVKK